MRSSSVINGAISSVVSIKKYTDDGFTSSEDLSSSYECDLGVMYDNITPTDLFYDRFSKLPRVSSKFTIKDSGATYLKLFIEKSITKVELCNADDEVVTTLYTESSENYDKSDADKRKLFEAYVVNEKDFDKVILLTNESFDQYFMIHTSDENKDAHSVDQVLSYHDSDRYTYIHKDLLNELVKVKNFEVNSGFIITEDFSKQFLGNYFVRNSEYV